MLSRAKRKIIKKYIHSVNKNLFYARKRKKEIIQDFREYINECVEEGNETINCVQDLYPLFGTVEEAVRNYMSVQEEEEAKAYEKEAKRRRIIINLVEIFLVFVIACFILIRIINSQYELHSKSGTIGTIESSSYEEAEV